MQVNRKYLVAVALLAVLAVVFGFAGTVAPLSQPALPQQASEEDSVAHFAYPPTYSSSWVNITDKKGRYFKLWHELNTTDVVVDIRGKQSLDPKGGILELSRTYGGASNDYAFSLLQTGDGGYALAGRTASYGAGGDDFWLVKTDAAGNALWNRTYGGVLADSANSLIQTSDGGYALAGHTQSYGAGGGDFWLVKTDAAGNALWNRTTGGADDDGAYSLVQTGDGGYAIAGYTYSYGAGGKDFWLVKTDAAGNALWNRTYGGALLDSANSLIQTSDGGYAIAGYTESYGAGSADFWLVKTNATGNTLWNQTYGGTEYDSASSLVQTSDGEYVLAGSTLSYGVVGFDFDFWLVKTDSLGNMMWQQTYGGTSNDLALSLVQADDGGYAIAGYTYSYGAGGTDFWLVRTDGAGALQWNQTYGGTNSDQAWSVVQTFDGGYAVAGPTVSYGAGGTDFWLVKVKAEMNLEHQINLGGASYMRGGWSETYGGTGGDEATSLVQTIDGGYALAGYTFSYGAGSADFWLVKTDSTGNMLWDRAYGGGDYDEAWSVVETANGGYAIVGRTQSYGAGGMDFWLVKTDSLGNMMWQQTYGGAISDQARSLVQTSDGGYAIAGDTNSYGAGLYDFWLVKTDSAGNMQWNKTYGGPDHDYALSLVQTDDGGYALVGQTRSFGAGNYDFWLVKTDSAGNMQWNKTYGGTNDDKGTSLVQTSDGGYALAGHTQSYGAGHSDFWLIKTDTGGNAFWSQTYGGASEDIAFSVVERGDVGYALAGRTISYGVGSYDCWLVETDADGMIRWSETYGGTNIDVAYSLIETIDGGYALAGYTWSYGAGVYNFWLVTPHVYAETGLTMVRVANNAVTLYRGSADPYWNYVHVRIWTIKEPTWQFGDINQDGVVDAKDLAIIGQNYGKTFSALSLGGIVAIAGIYAYKKRKRPK